MPSSNPASIVTLDRDGRIIDRADDHASTIEANIRQIRQETEAASADRQQNDDTDYDNDYADSETNEQEEEELTQFLRSLGADQILDDSIAGTSYMRDLSAIDPRDPLDVQDLVAFRTIVLRARRHLRRARAAVNRALDATDRYILPGDGSERGERSARERGSREGRRRRAADIAEPEHASRDERRRRDAD